MDSQKHLRIQSSFKVRHGVSKQVSFLRRANTNVVFLRRNPVNFRDQQKENFPARFKNEPLQVFPLWNGSAVCVLCSSPQVLDLLACTSDSIVQTIARERL